MMILLVDYYSLLKNGDGLILTPTTWEKNIYPTQAHLLFFTEQRASKQTKLICGAYYSLDLKTD